MQVARRDCRVRERRVVRNDDMKDKTRWRSAAEGHEAAGKDRNRGRRERTSGVRDRMPSTASDIESSSSSTRLKSERHTGR
jgi:hypothetical protein